MKKFLPFIATMFLLGGCTLSMEEWIVPEEDRGKDEIYTVENEYGTISYQFADSVLYVTDRIQSDYLVQVEHDSILYFNANIPDKWRPYKGMKLATGCSHMLPYGLNHRVLTVEDVGGILKVVATKVSTEEVYEHLSYCIDADVVSAELSGLSEEELLDYGYEMTVNEDGDTVIMDWNEYDVDKGLRPAAAKRRSLKQITRAEEENAKDDEKKDDMEEEKSDEGGESKEGTGTKSTTLIDFLFDTRDITNIKKGKGTIHKQFTDEILKQVEEKTKSLQQAAAQKGLNYDFYAGIGLKVVSFQRVHAEVDEDLGFEEKYSDSWTEWEIRAEAGYAASKNNNHGQSFDAATSTGVPGKKFLADLKQTWNDRKTKGLKMPGSVINKNHKWTNAQIRIIITTTPVPIAFIANCTFSPTIEVNGSICGVFKWTSDKVRTGYKIQNGKETKYEDVVVEESKFSTPKVIGCGSVKIGARFRVGAGIEFAGALGFTVGANIEGYLKFDPQFNITGAIFDEEGEEEESSVMSNFSGNIEFKLGLFGDVTVHVAPLGFHLWDKEVARFLEKDIVHFTTAFAPNISFCSGEAKTGKDLGILFTDEDRENEDMADVSGYYHIQSLTGIAALLNLSPTLHYPGMRIYFGPISDNNWDYMEPRFSTQVPYEEMTGMSKWISADAGETYHFKYAKELRKDAEGKSVTEINLVPTIYNYSSRINILYAGIQNMEGAKEYVKDEFLIKEHACQIEVGDPIITTLKAGQISGGDLFNFSNEIDGYVDVNKGASGGQSINTEDFRKYEFYTTLDVKNASRMSQWGVWVYIYGPDKETKLMRHHRVPIDQRRSGKYTLLFSFATNWNKEKVTSSADRSDEKLYFRVIPYWGSPVASGDATIDGKDAKSLKKNPIEYEMPSILEDIMDKNGNINWGSVLPEVDLHP